MSWVLIESQTLSGSAASVTLGSGGTIPQTYKSLKLLVSARTSRTSDTADYILLRPNAATTNLSDLPLLGLGSGAASTNTGTSGRIGAAATDLCTSGTFGNTECILPNYSSATNKPMSGDAVSENNGTSAYQFLIAGLWSNTAAITSLQLVPFLGTNFVSGSSFTLYGLS